MKKVFLNALKNLKLGISIKGIITVGLFGQPCDMKKLKKLLMQINSGFLMMQRNLLVQFTMIMYQVICAKSQRHHFFLLNLGCYGDGGALFTNDENFIK